LSEYESEFGHASMTNGLRRLKQLVPRRRKSAGGAAVYHRRADAAEFVERLQHAKVAPHIAQNTSNRRSAVPDAIAKGPGYAVSQLARKRIEEIFGWGKKSAAWPRLDYVALPWSIGACR
jgi:hypothetical protein